MNDENEVRRMTVQEIALVRAVVQWRRDNRTTFYLTRGGHGFAGLAGFAEWNRLVDGNRVCVVFERETPDTLTFTTDYHGAFGFERVKVASVTEAVDILAGVRILPRRFSSAYRAGWDAGRSDMEHAVAAGPEFAAVVPAVWWTA